MQPPLANVFQPLIHVFEAILKVFHDDIGVGWGLAIIALTLLIRSLLLPLTLKQLRSMYRIAQFTPEIKKLRDKHGSDPQRLQQETMAFYKKNRINPLASVLPALWQLPAGLLVYWITTNTWTIGQGVIVRKRLGHLRQAAHDAQAATGGRGGLGDLFKQLRGEDRAEPPPSGRRPRTSGDPTTKIPA